MLRFAQHDKIRTVIRIGTKTTPKLEDSLGGATHCYRFVIWLFVIPLVIYMPTRAWAWHRASIPPLSSGGLFEGLSIYPLMSVVEFAERNKEIVDSLFSRGGSEKEITQKHTIGRVDKMTRRNFVVGLECKTILAEAVSKRLPVKITNKHDTRWQVYKSGFLGVQGNRLVLSLPVSDIETSTNPIEEGQEIAVTFKKGYNKCLFVTRFIGPCEFESDPGEPVQAVQILWPQQIEKFQRRAFHRAPAPPGDSIQVTFWQTDTPAKERKEKKWRGILQDLSAGGLGVTMLKSEVPEFKTGEQFEMWFMPLPGQEPLCLPVWFRHITPLPETDRVMLGFQIVGLEISEEGRSLMRWIGRIANVYQRQRPVSEHGVQPTHKT